ncbi:unnamed protein product [Penicillium viridicatum]
MPEDSPILSFNDTELEVLMEIRYQEVERAAARVKILQEFWDIIVVYQELRAFDPSFLSPHHVDILFNLINHRMQALNEAMTVLNEEENLDNQIFGLSGIADVVTYPSTGRSVRWQPQCGPTSKSGRSRRGVV